MKAKDFFTKEELSLINICLQSKQVALLDLKYIYSGDDIVSQQMQTSAKYLNEKIEKLKVKLEIGNIRNRS